MGHVLRRSTNLPQNSTGLFKDDGISSTTGVFVMLTSKLGDIQIPQIRRCLSGEQMQLTADSVAQDLPVLGSTSAKVFLRKCNVI